RNVAGHGLAYTLSDASPDVEKTNHGYQVGVKDEAPCLWLNWKFVGPSCLEQARRQLARHAEQELGEVVRQSTFRRGKFDGQRLGSRNVRIKEQHRAIRTRH